jgi:hypothetical protein
MIILDIIEKKIRKKWLQTKCGDIFYSHNIYSNVYIHVRGESLSKRKK